MVFSTVLVLYLPKEHHSKGDNLLTFIEISCNSKTLKSFVMVTNLCNPYKIYDLHDVNAPKFLAKQLILWYNKLQGEISFSFNVIYEVPLEVRDRHPHRTSELQANLLEIPHIEQPSN